MTKLTSDDWKIYNYLKEHTGEWVMQEKIARDLFLEEWLDLFPEKQIPFHDLSIRKKITGAIRRINESDTIQKIILSTGKGIKIAEKDEIDNYIGRQVNSVIRRLNRIKKIAKKASRDGQYKITFGKYERQIIEAFPSEEDKPKPKYKVGDIVYQIEYYFDEYGKKSFMTLKDRIKKIYIGKKGVTYYLRSYPNGVAEKWLYPSLEAANAKISELNR